MKDKMRIQLLDEARVILSDRLIDQYSELLNGPTENHKDPFRVEFIIDSKETSDRIKAYLDRLTGNLPLVIKNASNKSTSGQKINPYKEIFTDIKGVKFIEEIIAYLENLNFRWVTYQLIQEQAQSGKFKYADFGIGSKYQWLVRMTRQAKDPNNDKFDWTMMIGIKFMGQLSDKVIVMYKGEKKALWVREWEKAKNLNMKKKKIPLIFPQYMTIEERKRWRYMRRKVMNKKELGKRDNQFYERYLPEVQNLDANSPDITLDKKVKERV